MRAERKPIQLRVLVLFGSLSYWSRSVNEVSTVTR